eukprot:4909489-Pyramimonas_sp.AAC.1
MYVEHLMWRRRGSACNICVVIVLYVVQHVWRNLCGAIDFYKRVDKLHALAHIQPTHPQPGLQNPCGGDCDECLALGGAPLRPRWSAHARARSGQLVWRDRRGR